MSRTKQWPCLLCETLYAELEEAEVCERSHDHDPDGEAFRGGEAAAYHAQEQERIQRELK